jgi:hypothetical protein
VTDSATPTPNTATKSLSITISTPLAITTTSLPNGFVGVAYSQTVAATGGTTPYTWTISVGSLPSGLSLNSSTGTISGSPTAAGTSSFTIQVTDSASPTHNTVTQALSITVPAPPAVTTNSATSVVQTSATLNGSLTALGASGSATLSFDWGTSTSYTGGNVAANPSSWNGGVPKAFTYNLTGLTHNTTYHYRAKAVGADGSIVYGSDKTFTTPW